jgi:hypothetical protein
MPYMQKPAGLLVLRVRRDQLVRSVPRVLKGLPDKTALRVRKDLLAQLELKVLLDP